MCNIYRTHPCGCYANTPWDNQDSIYNAYRTFQCPYFANTSMYDPNFPFDEMDYDSRFAFSKSAMGNDPIVLKDYGPQPYVVDIDRATKQNMNYRTALWTGNHLQLTLMSIRVGGDIGLEVHPVTDQFLRIEEGQGVAQMGPTKNNLNFQRNVSDGFAIFVPAGTWHNVVNTGNRPLKLYSIYAPPKHPHGTVHATKEIAHAGTGD